MWHINLYITKVKCDYFKIVTFRQKSVAITVYMKLNLTFTRVALFICFMAFGRSALAGDITKIQMRVDDTGQTQFSLNFQSENTPKLFTLDSSKDGGNPRIVIDVVGVNLSSAMKAHAGNNDYFGGAGAISKLRYASRGEDSLRFVADLRPDTKYLSHSYKDGRFIVLVAGGASIQIIDEIPVPRLKSGAVVAEAMVAEAMVDEGIPVPRLKASRRIKLAPKPVIVIDPGHGGHDPGAIGSAKTYEETVTLKAGLELRRQLLASGKYKVVMTRTTDRYIDHDKRVLIARKAGADLFISIHADSTSSATTRGASVYTLASRAEARTHKVVSQQKWVLDVDLTRKSAPVSDILVDLAQRKTLTKSGQFADILIPELKKKTRMVGNSHRRAGYYVLLAPDVPAVLLEMGFLSNAQDEKLLNSAAHRKKLMKSVKTAIDKYFKR